MPDEENDFEIKTVSPKIEYFVESLAPLSPPSAIFTSSFEMITLDIGDEQKKKKKTNCTLL